MRRKKAEQRQAMEMLRTDMPLPRERLPREIDPAVHLGRIYELHSCVGIPLLKRVTPMDTLMQSLKRCAGVIFIFGATPADRPWIRRKKFASAGLARLDRRLFQRQAAVLGRVLPQRGKIRIS